MHKGLHPTSNVQWWKRRGLISLKECVDGKNRSVARYAVKNLNLARSVMLTGYQRKKEVMRDYRNGKRILSMGNF